MTSFVHLQATPKMLSAWNSLACLRLKPIPMVLKHRKIDGHRVRPQLASTPGRVPTNHTFPHISIASSRNHFLEGSGMLKTSKRWRFNAPTAATSHSHHVMTFGCCIASNKEMANGQALAGTHLTRPWIRIHWGVDDDDGDDDVDDYYYYFKHPKIGVGSEVYKCHPLSNNYWSYSDISISKSYKP